MESPVVKTKKGFSPIWILPIVALVLGGWLIYKDFQESGIMITVRINDASGLTAGKTQVLFKGLPVGTLKEFSVTPDLQHIDAVIEMTKEAKEELNSDTKFWVVRPEVSMNRITGLDTLVRGSYFEVQPGSSKELSQFFIALNEPPPISERVPGLHLSLHSSGATSLSSGSPVLFKKVEVGEVISETLQKDGSIETKILIYPQFMEHATTSSRFYLSSGIHLQADIQKVSLQIDPIKAVIRGGICFDTPRGGETIDESSKSFTLYKDFQSAQTSERELGLHLTLHSSDSTSLSPGSPVLFKKIEVGEVISTTLQKDGSIKTELLIHPQFRHHVSTRSRFYLSSGIHIQADLPKISMQIDPVKAIIRGGVSFETLPGGKKITADTKPFPLHKDLQTAQHIDDIEIQLTFSVHHAIQAGADIRFQGVKIGSVTRLKLQDDLTTVQATAHIDKSLDRLLRVDTYIWPVTPKFGLTGISDLDTIVKGSYLNLIPGNGKAAKKFQVYDTKPTNMTLNTGLNLVLETDRLGSLGYNKPVYYRQVQVGHTTGYELSPTGQNVLVYLNIYAPYINLIREHTRFWNTSGLRIQGGLLTAMKISTESLAAILDGGISFSTPEKKDMGNRVTNGHHFILHSDPDDAWLNWSPTLELGEIPEKLKQEQEKIKTKE